MARGFAACKEAEALDKGNREIGELRMKFDETPESYDRYRPAYPEELFCDLFAYAELKEGKKALEVGVGTGQATGPILAAGCAVTALDIGENMVGYCRRRFVGVSDFQVECGAFEDYPGKEESYDLLYSATAFHWISPQVGFPKAYKLLKPGGTIALFWNHPFVGREEDPLHREIQKVYGKYRPQERPPREFSPKDCKRYVELLKEYGFTDVESRLYHRTRCMDGEAYGALLNTYSDHRGMEPQARAGLLRGIKSAIQAFGGSVLIHDTIDFYLGRKGR
jgi:SAM-dependent methyltransferase